MRSFFGSTGLVTGAASGIGRALAVECAERGMHVVLCDLDEPNLKQTQQECLSHQGATAEIVLLDVRDHGAFDALAARLENQRGGVDLLFNNAGVLVPRRVWEHSADEFDWLFNVNVGGVLNGIRAFVPRMLKRGTRAQIVNTGSIGGLIPSPMMGAYSASKAALWSLTESLYYDLLAIDSLIKVSYLAPGPVRSQIFDCQRHQSFRPVELAGAVAEMRDSMNSAINEIGMDPNQVAKIVFSAILLERFWIFPHLGMLGNLPYRTAEILGGNNPVFNFKRAFGN